MKKDVRKPHYVKTAAEILQLGIKEIPTLIKPILPKKGLALLVGSSDTGKSYLCLNLAMAISSDSPQILSFDIHRKEGKVIYVSTEDEEESICVRLTKLICVPKYNEDNLRFITDSANVVDKITKELEREPAELVIVDALGDVFSGKINDSIDVRAMLKPYKAISDKYNCVILFCHHIGKGKENNLHPSKNDTLGSQALEAACRVVLYLKKTSADNRTLTIVKGNHIPDSLKKSSLELYFNISNGFTSTGNEIPLHNDENAPSGVDKYDQELKDKVVSLHKQLGSYQKVSDALKKDGIHLNKNKIGEIIKSLEIPTENKIKVVKADAEKNDKDAVNGLSNSLEGEA